MKIIKKMWMPLTIALILVAFFGVVYYNNVIRPKQLVDKKIGYTPEEYITLGQYKGIKYEKQKAGVSDKELESAINDELTDYREVDREAKAGDSVNIDYKALINGKEDDNLSEEEFDIILGEEDLAKEFDDAVLGKKAGDKVSVILSDVSNFPTDEVVDYSGKKVEFKIKINSVSEEYQEELTDEWVEENYGAEYECYTVDDYKKMMKDSLMEDSEDTIEEEAQSDLWQKVVDSSKMNGYPQELYDEIVEIDDADMAYQADYWGMTLDEYYEFIGVDKDNLDEIYLEDVKAELVMWAIAKEEGIDVTEAEIEQGYEDMYEEFYYESVDEMKQTHTDDEIKHALIEYKVMEFIVDNAKITEIPSVESTEEEE